MRGARTRGTERLPWAWARRVESEARHEADGDATVSCVRARPAMRVRNMLANARLPRGSGRKKADVRPHVVAGEDEIKTTGESEVRVNDDV